MISNRATDVLRVGIHLSLGALVYICVTHLLSPKSPDPVEVRRTLKMVSVALQNYVSEFGQMPFTWRGDSHTLSHIALKRYVNDDGELDLDACLPRLVYHPLPISMFNQTQPIIVCVYSREYKNATQMYTISNVGSVNAVSIYGVSERLLGMPVIVDSRSVPVVSSDNLFRGKTAQPLEGRARN